MKEQPGQTQGARAASATPPPALQLTVRHKAKEDKDDEALPTGIDWHLFGRLWTFTRPYALKRNILFALVISRGLQIPILGWGTSAVINGPITARDWPGVVLWSLAWIAFALFLEVTMHFRQRLALEFGESVMHDLRNVVFRHVLRMPMSYFQRNRLGRILSRVTSDIEALRAGVQNVLFVSLVQGLQLFGSAALMLWSNWKLFLVILGMAPLLYFLNRYFGRRIAEASREVQESFSRVTSNLAESVKGMRVTQGFAREATNAGIFRTLVADHARYNMGVARNTAIYIPILELNSQFFIAALLLVSSFGMLQAGWDIRIADLITFFFLANLFFGPLQHLGNQYTQAIAAMAGAERVFRLLDTAPEWEDAPGARVLPPVRGEVVFEDIHFSYVPDKPVLQEIAFRAAPGQMIALVGHTGSGKTTIINLLAKFYLPTRGRVLVDGHDLAQITSASLHDQMAVVLQNNFLFSGTVLDNIRMGRPSATDAEVIEAVRQLNLLDLVEVMPDGFQTRVAENGAGLSLGQRQLVCFARAFIANPRILVLDEATSSLDTMTEARLQQALGTLLQGRTSFVIAHRLSTIRKADCVLVLDHGRIIERGSHAELLQLDGVYANLYRQFVEIEEEAPAGT